MRHIRELVNTVFRYKNALWQPFYEYIPNVTDKKLGIEGPLCLDCKTQLDVGSSGKEMICPNCNRKHLLEKDFNDLRSLAHRVYEAKLREKHEVISLDLPPNAIVSKDEDDNYWVEARIGQKNGKKAAVIYFGEKKHGEQSKKDYSQVFIDFDDEQMRFDKGNKNPLEIIGKLTAEFLSSVHNSEKKKK